MKTATLSIKTDPKVKQQAQQLAEELGIPLGSLINGFLKDAIKKQAVSFSARNERFPAEQMTPKMEKIIGEFEEKRRAGTLELVSYEDFMKHAKEGLNEDEEDS